MADYQLTYQGLTFGAGTVWQIARDGITGLEDLPTIRTGDQPRAYAHGEMPGLDLAAGRTILVPLEVFDSGAGDFAANVERLKAITAPLAVEQPLTFTLPGRAARTVSCRPRRRSLPVNLDYSFRYGHAVIEFHATDPRIYDASFTSSSLSLPSAATGLTFPATAPFVFGSAGTGGSATFTNSGNCPAPWIAQILGPVTNPVVTLAATGQAVAINGTVNAGETLTIDSLSHTVLLGGTASRASWVASTTVWWELPAATQAGPTTSTVQFGATSGTGTCTFSTRSAWL